MGLRADPEHIASLAEDPGAVSNGQRSGYGIPLTGAEVAELDRRARTADAVAEIVNEYARTVPERWAGLYIDQAAGGRVVAQFTGYPLEHRIALTRLLHPFAPLAVKQVRWSYRDLQPLWDDVERQRAWFDSIGAPLTGSGISETDNVVKVHLATADPSIADKVLDHFDAEGMLRVVLRGLPPWTGGFGDLAVRVHGPGIPPDRSIECVLRADTPGALDDDLHAGMDEHDVCSFIAPATDVVVAVIDLATGRELGRISLTVEANRVNNTSVAID